ncbi:MAG TPA: response regulator transcription factor [Bacteriovoracaceae bacterium]|nr:response regulator transcription factor [Bacteriovoracaceae bacterium]
MKGGIAYIDDDQANLECIRTLLKIEYDVDTYLKPEDFLKDYHRYSAILIDVHMPAMSGFELYEKIIEHEDYNGCPILFISSDDSDANKIKSFSLGAVDFVDRRTSQMELIARIKSRILFFQKHRSLIEFSYLRINLTLLKAYINNEELPLTFIEFKILCLVLRNYPEVITKVQLVEQVWKTGHVLDATIYTHVSNLNGKLGKWDYEINGLKSRGIQLVKKDNTL